MQLPARLTNLTLPEMHVGLLPCWHPSGAGMKNGAGYLRKFQAAATDQNYSISSRLMESVHLPHSETRTAGPEKGSMLRTFTTLPASSP